MIDLSCTMTRTRTKSRIQWNLKRILPNRTKIKSDTLLIQFCVLRLRWLEPIKLSTVIGVAHKGTVWTHDSCAVGHVSLQQFHFFQFTSELQKIWQPSLSKYCKRLDSSSAAAVDVTSCGARHNKPRPRAAVRAVVGLSHLRRSALFRRRSRVLLLTSGLHLRLFTPTSSTVSRSWRVYELKNSYGRW